MDSRRPPQKIPKGEVDDRFHYPQGSRLPQSIDSVSNQFPPHPSVRLPQNIRPATRAAPPGVGTGARSTRPANTPPRAANTGKMAQDYKFPQPPPPMPAAVRGQRSREFEAARKYNMHDSYVSSIYEDSTPSRNTPSSKSPGKSQPLVRDSASVYPETEAPDSPKAAYPSSRAIPQHEFPLSPVRDVDSAYPSSKTTPYINTTELDPPRRIREGEISPASSRTTAMNALSAAIAAGFSSSPKVENLKTPPSRTFSPVRMPFDHGSRPRTADGQSLHEALGLPDLTEPSSGKTPMLTPSSVKSGQSTNPLLGLGINKPGMSSKVPMTRRPPRLDIDAVRDMEARGSTTSLTDLIRRATKLAANLDRGKTASRLGMLDGFGNSKDRLGPLAPGRRDSTMSDMLSSFPAPAAGGTPRRDTMWPLGGKDELGREGEKGKSKRKRRCCGMSMPVAILVMIVLVMLVAAAVLIPIFLILVPKQHTASGPNLSQCATLYPCNNGGISVLANGNCQCVCANGFTGAHCGVTGGSDCSSTTFNDGSTTLKNATVGKAVIPVFDDAQSQFNIPLNASSILSVFSSQELSCSGENILVTFNSTSAAKRFVIVPGLESDVAYTPHLILVPTRATASLITATPRLERRGDPTVGSSNGIVFQKTPGVEPSSASISTIVSVETTTTSSGATPTSTSGSTLNPSVIEQQTAFAQVVVLFALQESSTVVFAVNAQQSMNLFLAGTTSNSTVNVGTAALPMTVNFNTLEITTGNGTTFGGKAGGS